ncbi:MAG: SGNH/GDSL hydrolase family protein, partial [Candidatus Symbiothrix sp.]|nr:SGNH/GDSL hydrolase family protein [Candidatus Symbiothrix sp.]
MRLLLILLISIVSTMAQAQRVYYSADSFPLLGKVSEHTETRYERLPERLKNISREKLWSLGKNTAGLAIRFRSNTTSIAAGWEPLNDAYMNHMTPTGIKGLDLYSLENGEWVFVNSGRPNGKISDALIISNMTPEMREYMLYLPLYDGITSLQIGIDSLAFIGQPLVDSPKREKPVVCYGSSILQGGCATRPGMAHTNILSRRFNREFINLGFSGNALLDYEIAEIIAPVDASLYILDFVPNASVNEMKEKAEYFYAIIRKIRPDTPILFVEDPVFTHTRFDQRIAKEVSDKNATIGQIVEMLKAKGDKNIYLVSSKDMLGHDGEATVDGIHFT